MAPLLCMVTDRRRHGGRWEDALVRRVAAAALAGVHLVQIREPGLADVDLLRLVAEILRAVSGTGCRVLVNDRIDIALSAGAHGVHLRSDSPPASRVRRVLDRGHLVGRSIHSAEEARAAAADGGADYLVAGTIFASTSKPGVSPAGLSALEAAVRATPLPVLAIGGVTAEQFGAIAGTGAAGAAAIGLFADGDESDLQARLRIARRAFDSVRGSS